MPDENATRSTSTPHKPLFNPDDVLRCDNETLYDQTVVFATQLAILGYTDAALRLVGKLSTYDWYHPYVARLRPLHILWNVIGQWLAQNAPCISAKPRVYFRSLVAA